MHRIRVDRSNRGKIFAPLTVEERPLGLVEDN